MDNFFRHCQKFDGSPGTDIEMVKLLKVRSFEEALPLTDTHSPSLTYIITSFRAFFLVDFLKVLSSQQV